MSVGLCTCQGHRASCLPLREAPAQGREGVWCGSQNSAAAVTPLHLCNSLAVSFYTGHWKKPPSKPRCSEELLLSAVKASELLLRERGQVNSTPCKITAVAVKYGLTLTPWSYLEIYLEMLCGFAPSVPEFALQAQGGGPAIPQGTALCH